MSTEALLQERKSTHGEYREHARCTQAIMRAVMTERNWEKLSDIQRESLHMFAHKMGRIAVGNPDEPDHWKDIAGYAVLVEQRLGKKPKLAVPDEKYTSFPMRPLGPVPGDEDPNAELKARHPAAPRPASFDIGGGRFEVGETCHYHETSGARVKMLCQITSILQDGEADIDCGQFGHKTVKWHTLTKLPRQRALDTPSCGDGLADVHARHALLAHQRTPEDGAQHASVVPWAVTPGYLRMQGINPEHVAAFWHARTSSSFVLEPYVISGTIPRVLRTCYNLRGDGNWTLRIADCPPDVREFFPDLPMEQNMKEWEERPEWQRVLYTWSVEGNKYALTDLTCAWHVDSE